jgi:hypothetical protein
MVVKRYLQVYITNVSTNLDSLSLFFLPS